MQARYLIDTIRGMDTSDGAGVKLTRVIGQPALPMLDPFLMLDAFRSDVPGEYLAGFPSHPHRGFETVTYLLAGRMRHKDSAGHEGVIESGDIQWMTAGRGIVHSEMPEQEDGLLEGFQLWINLPAAHKMDAPHYQERGASQIPQEQRDGAIVRVIAGTTSGGTTGVIHQPLTEPIYLDITLDARKYVQEQLPTGHNAFIYVIQGDVTLDDAQGDAHSLRRDDLAVLSLGGHVSIHNRGDQSARFLLIAGKPIGELVARGGPFVMNTRDEIHQAFEDYECGMF